jgi:predicted peroxiredoxin
VADGKVVINLSSGPEDPETVTVAFVVADSALSSGRELVIFLTKDAVRLALKGEAAKIAVPGYKPLAQLFEAVAAAGGQLHCCTPCFKSRGLDPASLAPNAKVSGAMNLFEWMGDAGATVFSF